MLMLFLLALLIACITGIIAYVYVSLLGFEPGMLFSPLYRIASEAAERRPWLEWILKPIILCSLCVSGQMALWSFVYAVIRLQLHYCLPAHLFCIALSILITNFLNKHL